TYYSDQEEEGNLVVLTPKLTYSRYIGLSFSSIESENAETASVQETAQTAETTTDNEETLLTTLKDLRKDNEKEPCQMVQTQTSEDNRKTKTSIEIQNLEEGKCVWAKDDGDWFKAKVVKMKVDGVKVHYVGYGAQFDKWLSLDEVKDYEFSIGEDVKARWDDGFFYKGKIVEKNAKVYTVLFNDGVTGRTEHVKF
ncbi:uncharacterized protein LOC134267388, partial [Saccostrea cucullata]|uniref:uncharacterized protein LOC134267388 n=1 Tax=Saccostrea cuccullata TaxID=36930 RepID=UPI002ED2C5A6